MLSILWTKEVKKLRRLLETPPKLTGSHQPFKSGTHLRLTWADVELLQDVDEEVLDLVPGVDGVGAVQDNYNVYECLTPFGRGRDENMDE